MEPPRALKRIENSEADDVVRGALADRFSSPSGEGIRECCTDGSVPAGTRSKCDSFA
jgi:hypothetical protein